MANFIGICWALQPNLLFCCHTYTNIFGIKGLLIRIKDGFEIAVESSYADMLVDYLQRANA